MRSKSCKYLFIILLFVFKCSFGQNKQVLFGFDEIPQNLMVNPSATINHKFHFNVPLLSGIYVKAGLTGFKIADLFEDDGLNINTKLNRLLKKTSRNDYYTINQQLELFNIGFRLNNHKKDYINFGFYQEFDAILYHPKDLITLAYEGNQDLTKTFNLNDISFKAEMLGVFHIGINRKIDKKLTIGLRAKLYSSVFNTTSRVNTGILSTALGENNIYLHRLSNVDLEVRTSGITNANGDVIVDKNPIGKFLLSGNMGLGIDFGINYKLKNNLEIKASVSDLGFIRHVKNTTTYQTNGSYTFEGLDLLFPTGDIVEYWQNLEDDVEEEFPLDTLNINYTTIRSLKLNSSISYKFGRTKENDCLRTEANNPKANEIGMQLFSIFRPKRPQFAATLFYYRRFSKYFKTKITYTVDDFSYTNIGSGFSTQIGKFNLYATADNLLGLTDLAKSNSQSFQFGMNLIFDN